MEEHEDICDPHNLTEDPAEKRPYGIRVKAGENDPFARLVGDDWEKTHWFPTAEERDRVLADMSSRHLYSRDSDTPTLIFEPIDR